MLKPNPQGDGISRWGIWEVIRSWGVSALMKDTSESSLSPSAMGSYSKNSHLWTRKRALTRQWICQHLELGPPSLQNCEKCFLFKLLSLSYFHYSSPKGLTHTYTHWWKNLDQFKFQEGKDHGCLVYYCNLLFTLYPLLCLSHRRLSDQSTVVEQMKK